jgi:hypothetical protein
MLCRFSLLFQPSNRAENRRSRKLSNVAVNAFSTLCRLSRTLYQRTLFRPDRQGSGAVSALRYQEKLLYRQSLPGFYPLQIADGHTNTEIAEKLVISLKTVRNHVSNTFSKLQVADRAQAALRARSGTW